MHSLPVSNSLCGRPTGPFQNPTTSFLTDTTLIYAIGAGISAAAGTRLALQLFLIKGFKLYSCKLRGIHPGIHVVKGTVKQTITDLMSHSQFHSTSAYAYTSA